MYRSILLSLAGAAVVAAQGFTSECTDIEIRQNWLVASCPTGNGDSITSSVFLFNKLSNNNANLEWVVDGKYAQSCNSCVLEGPALTCQCRGNWVSSQSTTINLEEHIANYEGHLLSNQTGAITEIPENASVPVPADFGLGIGLPGQAYPCENPGVNLYLNPNPCYYANFGVQDLQYFKGQTTTNDGFEIKVHPDEECQETPVFTFLPENDDTCVEFPSPGKAFAIRPLFNADW
ncbi:Cyanovirin-N [Aspergillus karnatakaensis]|uniref:CVNH domain-containing protein n=1 Tax=Aspergillus karnatakaensis TaxID=1810916 RepID=UPI003CCD6FEC